MKRNVLLCVAALAVAQTIAAQPVTCPAPGTDWVRIPEIVRTEGTSGSPGKLKGTIIISAEQQCISSRVPPSHQTPASKASWAPQFVRVIRGVGALPAAPVVPPNSYPYPLPGPTLRARVGDLVKLTLLNHIDPGKFPYSIDQGEKDPPGCDQTSTYPNFPGVPPQYVDTFPDCFHGSSTVNIHFHGTHVNPNSTGDNVFLELRPSPRTKDAANAPTITQATVKDDFETFFGDCEQRLLPSTPLVQWPFVSSDLPPNYMTLQMNALTEYDKTAGQKLWPVDARQIKDGDWPQYFIGAYPYCYRIPQYTQATWPPSTSSPHAAHTAGAGTAEKPGVEPDRQLIMGQSPGTHWYHAHKHGSTAINVANGMTGAFIIEGPYDDDLNAFYGKDWTRSQPVIVINQIGVSPNLERGGGTLKPTNKPAGQDKGPDFSVNGRLTPVLKMAPGEVQLWRIVNTSGRAGVHFSTPPAGFHWKQIAQDGVQFNNVNYQANKDEDFLLMSGNRADLLVMAPAKAGTTLYNVMAQNEVDPTDNLPENILFSVQVTGAPATGNNTKFIPNAPAFPPFLADIPASDVKVRRELVFESQFPNAGPPPSIHTIDGKKFSGEVGEVVRLNTIEEWKIVNKTFGPAISHPFHIHINPFQVVEVFAPNSQITNPATGQPVQQYVFDRKALTVPGQCYLNPSAPETWKPCDAQQPTSPPNRIWWDVFPIPSGINATDAAGKPINDLAGNPIQVPGYFKMRSRFVDYTGYYVIHCHILAHEDRGMMTIVEVAPLRSPYSHH